ncbi:MAG: hypothetical protein LC769_04545 [Chloroflexi bacterium]|nr:hypothetical protein [Chloroflexota bacterium]
MGAATPEHSARRRLTLETAAWSRRRAHRRGCVAGSVDLWPSEIEAQGLLAVTPERIALTREAHLLGHYVWEHFL